ncbi:DUF4333 domain-containing protein [Mycobacterium sp. C31M]
MTRPPDPNQPPGQAQPWWARPGGATPPPGAYPPQPPRPVYPQPPQARPPYPPPPQQRSPYPPPTPPVAPPRPQQVDPHRYTLRPEQQPAGHRKQSGKSTNRRTLIIAGIGVLAAVVIGVGVWQVAFHQSAVIKVETAEAGVRTILSDPINGYGANAISAMRCNGGKDPSAVKGDSFTCEVEIDGTIRQVYVEFTDDNGTFAVDGPR